MSSDPKSFKETPWHREHREQYERIHKDFDAISGRIEEIVRAGIKPGRADTSLLKMQRGKVPEGHIFFYGVQDMQNAFLDNFYPCAFTVDGATYASSEHFYQSRKTGDHELRAWIIAAPTAAEAKRRGNSLKPGQMTKDWDTKKIEAMKEALLNKFCYGYSINGEPLRDMLLATGTKKMHEDSPGDKIWGVEGLDLLGLVLVLTRQSLLIEGFHRS